MQRPAAEVVTRNQATSAEARRQRTAADEPMTAKDVEIRWQTFWNARASGLVFNFNAETGSQEADLTEEGNPNGENISTDRGERKR